MQKIFLYCIHWPSTLLLQLTRAVTKALKFQLFYKPFEKCNTGAQCESNPFAKLSIFQLFYKQFWQVGVQLQLDRPRTKMLFSPMEFHMFWRNISNYHGESDGSVALLSQWKFAMFWRNTSNSIHESNVSDSVDLSVSRSINHLVNY